MSNNSFFSCFEVAKILLFSHPANFFSSFLQNIFHHTDFQTHFFTPNGSHTPPLPCFLPSLGCIFPHFRGIQQRPSTSNIHYHLYINFIPKTPTLRSNSRTSLFILNNTHLKHFYLLPSIASTLPPHGLQPCNPQMEGKTKNNTHILQPHMSAEAANLKIITQCRNRSNDRIHSPSAPVHSHYRTVFDFLYSMGVAPVFFLNTLIICEAEEKSSRSAI